MADDNTDHVVSERDEAASITSTVSWNTFLLRTNISSVASAMFSQQETHFLHGLGDVIRAATTLGLRRYRYEEIAREEKVGEGETYLVERCVVANQVLAVKHLKANPTLDDRTSHRRLRAVILELQILRHRPLRNHPNFPFAFGYGWNMNGSLILPYVLVQYAPEGTLRQYIKSMSSRIPLRDWMFLAGDVASALYALHKCGIVHGDVKLDNVLVVYFGGRSNNALAKLTDFGHALVMNDRSSKHGGTVRYGGTFIYNAPEVHDQDTFPIDPAAMPQCDIWAFGLLVWELCLQGEDHISYSKRRWPEVKERMTEQRLNPADVRQYALASMPGTVEYVLIRATLHYTLQHDLTKRIAHLEGLPLLRTWHAASISGLQSELAFHLESPSPTYEMFRPENGHEIPWKHEEQIFQALERTHSNKHARDKSLVSWQLALCYHVGFGTPRNPVIACKYAKIAQEQGHLVAVAFASLLDLDSTVPSEPYITKIRRLLQTAIPPDCLPPVIQACFDGDPKMVKFLLSEQEDPNSSTIDGCTMFHWFFMLEDPKAMAETMKSMFTESFLFHTDLPFSNLRKVHDQWPLQLLGTPLGTAISVNSLPTVKALLALGASPLSYVYRKEDFPAGDLRVKWTALHVAAKYHCSEILEYLLSVVPKASLAILCSLACALPFSTSLDRLAIHGALRQAELDKTIAAIRKVQSLQTPLLSGMTAFTQAIDFQDYDVAAALVRAEPGLASCRLTSVEDPAVFNLPIHLAAQIAARRDVPEALSILQLINHYTNDFNAETKPSRDHLGRTSLHLAVTGPSSRAAKWIVEQRIGLLDVEDDLGRTALHYCASEANLEFLLAQGSNILHTDKYGMNTLHRACLRGEWGLVRCLLKRNQPLDLKNNNYGTPLHCAIINGSVDVVMALLEAGAPINAQDRRGNNAADVAVRMGRYTILRHLLKRDGSHSPYDFNQKNPEIWPVPRNITSGEAPIPDFAWDANDVSRDTLTKNDNSNLDEVGRMGHKELHDFQDSPKDKKKLLQKLTSTIIDDIEYDSMDYVTIGLIMGQVTTSLHAQILPYLDDSIWRNDKPSTIPIGKILARTAFGIARILEFVMNDQQPMSPSYQKGEQDIVKHEKETTQIYKELEVYMELAINQTIEIVEQTKPNWAMPSRSRRHLENMVTFEVAWTQKVGDARALNAHLNNGPMPINHPILKDYFLSEDRKETRSKLQQDKSHHEREASRTRGRTRTYSPIVMDDAFFADNPSYY